MALDSEARWDALAVLLRDRLAGSVKSVDRRLKATYADVELPVVVVLDDDGIEEFTGDAGEAMEPSWRLTGDVWIIARTVETDTSPTTQLNTLVTALREALERDPSEPLSANGRIEFYTNLGGLVHSLAIQSVEKGSGSLAGTAVAQVKITMEALG